MNDIYETLRELEIDFVKHEHPAVFTVEESKKVKAQISGGQTKNLFLRNKKGDRHYLVAIEHEKRADLKDLKEKLHESKLSFASPERLKKHLGLTPGSVSLLGLINNKAHDIIVVVDEDLWKSDVICCHPNINTATLELKKTDLETFFRACGNEVRILPI